MKTQRWGYCCEEQPTVDPETGKCQNGCRPKNKSSHTPTPWVHQDQGMDSYTCIYDTRNPQGKIANVFGDGINEALENAAFIVRAVNAHDELLSTSKSLIAFLKEPMHKRAENELKEIIVRLHQAIAKAESHQ